MGYIYEIINQSNNKLYVGKTTQTIKQRFSAHKSSSDNTLMHSEMRLHPEQFTIKQLEECPDKDLSVRELYWILHERSYAPFGYNKELILATAKMRSLFYCIGNRGEIVEMPN